MSTTRRNGGQLRRPISAARVFGPLDFRRRSLARWARVAGGPLA